MKGHVSPSDELITFDCVCQGRRSNKMTIKLSPGNVR